MTAVSKSKPWCSLWLLATWLLATGCESCQSEKPYTPFGVASSLPAPSPSVSSKPSPSASASAPQFAEQRATRAGDQRERWSFSGQALNAPENQVFERALSADFDADKKNEIVAWTVAKKSDPRISPGELWLFDEGATPRRLATMMPFIPSGPSCSHKARLTQTGPHTVTLDVSAQCKTRLVRRTPTRALSVFAPKRPQPRVFQLRLAAPDQTETLKVSASTKDRDGDGQDDITLTFTGGRRDTPPAKATFIWLDRAQGPAREDAEPAQSWARQASRQVVRATGAKTHKDVPQAVENLLRLYSNVCGEAKAARVFDADGDPLACGSLETTFFRLRLAQVKAALTAKDALSAESVLLQDGWFGPKLTDQQRSELSELIKKALKTRSCAVTQLAARSKQATASPRFSPLSFEPSGGLLIQSAHRVVRYETGEETPVSPDAGTTGWPLAVVSLGGRQLTGAVLSCEEPEVALTFATPGGAGSTLPTGLLSPRPSVCAGAAHPAPKVTVLGFDGERPDLIIKGHLFGRLAASSRALPAPPGSARSPDGRWLVVPTSLGLLVISTRVASTSVVADAVASDESELWELPSSVDSASLTDCVVANGRARVACLDKDRVNVFSPK